LRCSPNVRSLNFSQGLAQVSSRSLGHIAKFGDISARFPLRAEVKSVTTAVSLSLFLLVSFDFPRKKRNEDCLRKTVCSSPAPVGMMLLILFAVLPLRFRFCLNRHNSATDNSPARGEGHRRCSRLSESGRAAGIGRQYRSRAARRTAAEELGNRWRYFATYTPVQTSPVFRHPFLARVIANVRSDACRPALR
jgi:hypothetical protein